MTICINQLQNLLLAKLILENKCTWASLNKFKQVSLNKCNAGLII